jgi:hypothetical protein
MLEDFGFLYRVIVRVSHTDGGVALISPITRSVDRVSMILAPCVAVVDDRTCETMANNSLCTAFLPLGAQEGECEG